MPQTPTKQLQWVTTGTGGSARHARDMKRPRRLVARGPEEPSRKRRCQADRPIKDDLSGVASRRPIDSFKTAKQQEPYRWIRQFTGEVAAKKMLGSLPRGGMENAYLPIGVGRSRRLLGSNAKGRHPDASQRQLRRRGGCSAATL